MRHSLSNLRWPVACLCISLALWHGGQDWMASAASAASAADAEAQEGDVLVFTVEKPKIIHSGHTTSFVSSIRYSLKAEDGTAKAGEDYQAVTTRKVTFPAGTGGSKKIRVRTILDNIDEGDGETFRIILSDPKVYDRYCKCYKSKTFVPLPAEIVLTGKILERLPTGELGLLSG